MDDFSRAIGSAGCGLVDLLPGSAGPAGKADRAAQLSAALGAGLRVHDPHSFYDSDEFEESTGLFIDRSAEKRDRALAERRQRSGTRGQGKATTLSASTTAAGGAANNTKFYTPAATDDRGNVVFPIEVRGMMVHALGTVVTDRPNFHEKRYIWPVGFKSEREYNSMTVLDRKCRYVSEIQDRGGDGPVFVVTCIDPVDPEAPPIVLEGVTASGCWGEIGRRYFQLRKELTGQDTLTQISGPEMFGYAHLTINKLIQDLPGAELCEKYIRKDFVEKPNTRSAGDGALAKKKRKSSSSSTTKMSSSSSPSSSSSKRSKRSKNHRKKSSHGEMDFDDVLLEDSSDEHAPPPPRKKARIEDSREVDSDDEDYIP